MGCVKPAAVIVWEEGDDEFFNCPIRWLGENIFAWSDRYNYYRESGRWPDYDAIGNRFWEAICFYLAERNRFNMQLTKNKPISNDLKMMRRENA